MVRKEKYGGNKNKEEKLLSQTGGGAVGVNGLGNLDDFSRFHFPPFSFWTEQLRQRRQHHSCRRERLHPFQGEKRAPAVLGTRAENSS